MDFTPETALAYARSISRPRRVGSGEEEKVAQEIAARLEQFGWQVKRQPFQFSAAFSIILAFEILAGELLILAALWTRGTWVAALCAALLLLLVAGFGPLNKAARAGSLTPETGGRPSRWSALLQKLGRPYRTANLVAELPGAPEEAALPHLYLVAHYDSKSQRLPLGLRMALFSVTLAGAAAFAGFSLAQPAFPGVQPITTASGVLALLASLPLLFGQDVGNASPGAIDDASGVGLVLHLAECLGRRPDWQDRLRVRLLITSAEEWAVMGAAAYVREHLAGLRCQSQRGGLYVLNFDGVGVKGRLCYVGGSNRLLALIREACRELSLPLSRFNLVGALFDHLPFAEAGLEAISLTTVGRASWWVHTPQDSADKLDAEGFRQAGLVAVRVMERL